MANLLSDRVRANHEQEQEHQSQAFDVHGSLSLSLDGRLTPGVTRRASNYGTANLPLRGTLIRLRVDDVVRPPGPRLGLFVPSLNSLLPDVFIPYLRIPRNVIGQHAYALL